MPLSSATVFSKILEIFRLSSVFLQAADQLLKMMTDPK